MHALARAMQAVQAVQVMQAIEHDNDEDAVQGSLILKRLHFASHYRFVHSPPHPFVFFLILLFPFSSGYHALARALRCA